MKTKNIAEAPVTAEEVCEIVRLRGRRRVMTMPRPKGIHTIVAVGGGEVGVILNGARHRGSRGDIYDVGEGDFFIFTDATTDAHIDVVSITAKAFRQIFADNPYPLPHIYEVQRWFAPVVTRDANFGDTFARYVESVQALPKHRTDEIKASLLKSLILDLCDASLRSHEYRHMDVGNSAVELATAFKHLFYNQGHPRRDVGWYAAKLGVTPQHFAGAVKEVSGYAPSQILNHCTIRSICHDLCRGMSLIEVAETHSFGSTTALSTFLRTEIDLTAERLFKIIRDHVEA
ncbi:MAG: helix-turn-helix domain-containing protein [Muribaculaceae bacterium]